MKKKTRIIFICTGNAFRSQMAEGFARHYGADKVEVFSAGVMASGVHPVAIETMGELGIDISGHTSEKINSNLLKTMDYVVTVCDNAKEHCPYVPEAKKVLHWSIPDPYRAVGTLNEQKVLRETRDDIERRVKELLEQISSEV
ncbi:MAG: hypothetical protein COX62_03315 [Deltaproteobacteria bacterium CG_4_10_14_0_2_um_filter_43_8]|nr:MAG: hypothetical protein COV43_03860 [Deltaproteobacteria bacterium CG11_big_fil_rev_8_21_14_0_20_42_23]PJA21099.1 MAG: hypothetical protein COX62_03315 [Deltaproteobacteria bacterium CG_4_10_14_0_2_um_filter_43_8]PJC63372.1 MAG: hypothetical protein CO021_09830 [Deltaproteobacteria bacterium CG_4_9_14_0_2_um_filter_42_21]